MSQTETPSQAAEQGEKKIPGLNEDSKKTFGQMRDEIVGDVPIVINASAQEADQEEDALANMSEGQAPEAFSQAQVEARTITEEAKDGLQKELSDIESNAWDETRASFEDARQLELGQLNTQRDNLEKQIKSMGKLAFLSSEKRAAKAALREQMAKLDDVIDSVATKPYSEGATWESQTGQPTITVEKAAPSEPVPGSAEDNVINFPEQPDDIDLTNDPEIEMVEEESPKAATEDAPEAPAVPAGEAPVAGTNEEWDAHRQQFEDDRQAALAELNNQWADAVGQLTEVGLSQNEIKNLMGEPQVPETVWQQLENKKKGTFESWAKVNARLGHLEELKQQITGLEEQVQGTATREYIPGENWDKSSPAEQAKTDAAPDHVRSGAELDEDAIAREWEAAQQAGSVETAPAPVEVTLNENAIQLLNDKKEALIASVQTIDASQLDKLSQERAYALWQDEGSQENEPQEVQDARYLKAQEQLKAEIAAQAEQAAQLEEAFQNLAQAVQAHLEGRAKSQGQEQADWFQAEAIVLNEVLDELNDINEPGDELNALLDLQAIRSKTETKAQEIHEQNQAPAPAEESDYDDDTASAAPEQAQAEESQSQEGELISFAERYIQSKLLSRLQQNEATNSVITRGEKLHFSQNKSGELIISAYEDGSLKPIHGFKSGEIPSDIKTQMSQLPETSYNVERDVPKSEAAAAA